MLRFTVENPSGEVVYINADSERFADIQDGLCHLSVLDRTSQRRTYPYEFWGVTSNDFCLSTLDTSVDFEPGDTREHFVVVPEPLAGVTSVTIEVPSFGLFDVAVGK